MCGWGVGGSRWRRRNGDREGTRSEGAGPLSFRIEKDDNLEYTIELQETE